MVPQIKLINMPVIVTLQWVLSTLRSFVLDVNFLLKQMNKRMTILDFESFLMYFWSCKTSLELLLVFFILYYWSFVSMCQTLYFHFTFFFLIFSLLKLMKNNLNSDFVISSCFYTRVKHNFEKHCFYIFNKLSIKMFNRVEPRTEFYSNSQENTLHIDTY